MTRNKRKICMQAIEWLEAHGLSYLGTECKAADCVGRYIPVESSKAYLRCDVCRAKKSRRGEFFSHYKQVATTIQLIYMVANRWRPETMRHELDFRDRSRITAVIDHLGRIAQHAGELQLKSQCGKWEFAMADEAATGQAKKVRGAAHRPGTKKGLAWFLTLVNYEPQADGSRCVLVL